MRSCLTSPPIRERVERTFALDLLHREGTIGDLERQFLANEIVVESNLCRIVPGAGVKDAIEPFPVGRDQARRPGFAARAKLSAAQIESA